MPFTSHKNVLGRGRILLDFHNPCIDVRRDPGEPALGSLGKLQRQPGLYILGFPYPGILRQGEIYGHLLLHTCVHRTGEHIHTYMP